MKVWQSSTPDSSFLLTEIPEAWEKPEPLFLKTMQGKKAVFLFLALLLPVGIFIFLKVFGKNEFDVPAYYQDKAPNVSASCQYDYSSPYRVADSVISRLEAKQRNKLYLIHFSDLTSRMKQEIVHKEVSFIPANDLADQVGMGSLKTCVLLVPGTEDLVIVDMDGKIRGYYTSTNREEVDRLLLELEILLKKY
jgi:hypothetical protein